jgi:cell division protein FtsI/penicillin-binding protein 2
MLFTGITVALWVRLCQVQYVRSDFYSSLKDRQMITTEAISPVRGGIFDRHGRPLALSVRLESVYVDPSRVTEPGRVERTAARLLGLSRREVRRRLRSPGSFVWLKRRCVLPEETAKDLRALDGVGIEMEQGRVYPYGATAAKLVGFVGVDNRGMAGVEAAYEDVLRGVPGSARVIKNGDYHSDRYYKFVEKDPRDGEQVYLTIDVSIQESAEAAIARAVERHGAASGSVVVMDVGTGELLALAEYPRPAGRSGAQLTDSLWTVRSVSHVFEPGSTFKLITSAALLDERLVSPADSFDAENGRADVGAAVITDPHPHGSISFEDAFAYSSNIVMYKSAERIGAEEFYRYIRMFGFGEKTGIELLGESPGGVAAVDDWSLRTKGTVAFGQEVAVTALQMVGAFGVVANDGEMVLPRLIKGVADVSTGRITKSSPVRVRRVVSKSTARALGRFCRRAVEDGTGEQANTRLFAVSGKTGTAQKASRRGGYAPGRYVSSFVGFAPHDDPRIVCLVLLDEPVYASRYGGVSCAPVFAELCEDIASTTDVFDGALGETRVAAKRIENNEYRAPNFLRMDRAQALERARKLGCNVLCRGDAGRVVSQNPDPGVPMDRDAVIRLTVAPCGDAGKRRVTPRLIGLTVREAKAVAVRSGFKCQLVGGGIVRKQSPAPGRASAGGTVRLYCDAVGGGGIRSSL